jgi:Tol biopolymer transport system component
LEQLDGWSADGRWVYFSSTSHDISGMNDVFRVSAEGGTPMEVAGDRYTNEYFASPSQDGTSLAISARYGVGQWWRNGQAIWTRRRSGWSVPPTVRRNTSGH